MLTKQELIRQFDWERRIILPDRLTRRQHSHYLALADEMLAIYRQGIGKTRKELHRGVARCLQDVSDCPTRRVTAFCKLLDDASQYHKDRGNAAAKLRTKVFSIAAEHHPLVERPDKLFENAQSVVKQAIAKEIGMPWEEIESRLFADVIEFHSLEKAPVELDAGRLLSRYNVAQTQGALYDAASMTVWARSDFKLILRYAKLARLMHTIERRGDGYLFHFNGPASVLRQTRRYGVLFARFLPGLLSTKDWKMQAKVLGPGRQPFRLTLSDTDGLKSEVESLEFDSRVEETFSARWKATDTKGWALKREATVLHHHQTVFMPDFTLEHTDGRVAQLEIVGFWTPEYLQEKAERLAQFRDHGRIVLAVAQSVSETLGDLGLPTVIYKTAIKPRQILDLLEDS